MPITIGTVIQACVLFTNALAVLHEERFLKRIGLGEDAVALEQGLKQQIVSLLKAVRIVTRAPLILVNTGVVLYLIVMG